jgi:hypothetical protein
VLCWPAFPLVPALGSTSSAADCSALFAGFSATMLGSDFPCPCIIGFGSSPSRCGPGATRATGQTRDLPASGASPLHVMCSSTPAGRQRLALAALHMLRSTFCTVSAPAMYTFRGSIDTHAIAVYASWPALPTAHATLATGRLARPYPGRTFTGWTAPALAGAFAKMCQNPTLNGFITGTVSRAIVMW